MTKFKRIVCLLLAVAMVFSLAACGNSNTESIVDLGEDEEWGIEADTPENSTDVGTDGETSDAEGTGDKNDGSTSGVDSNDKNKSDKNNNTDKNNTDKNNNTDKGNNDNKKPSVQTPTIDNPDKLSWKELLAQMPSSLRGTELNVYSWNPIKDVTGAEKVISDFEKQTGIDVKWTVGNYDDYDSSIAALINSGDSPDIIRYNHPSPDKMYLTQDVKTATGYDFSGDIWDSRVTSAYSVNGKIYGVNLRNTFNQQPTVVTYAMSTIDRYKLDDPYTLWKNGDWTWDKFIEMCKEFKEETNRPAWMTSGHMEPLWFNNVNMIAFNGKKYTNNISSPDVLKALQQSANFLADGITCEAMREHDKLEDGSYLFFTTNILAARRTDFHFSTLKSNDDLYCVPVPEGFGSKYYVHWQEFEAYGIPKGAKNAGAVYYFLRYYLDAENYDEDMFFVNDQTLETYKYCMEQKNSHYTIDGALTGVVGESNGDLATFIRTGGTAAQVKNKLDEVKGLFDRAVKHGNDIIAKY